jgi:hypothetical protein
MPVNHRAVRAIGCTIAVWDGDLTTEDMQQQLIRLASDPDWPPGPLHLVDGTTLGSAMIPDPELLELLYEGTNLVQQMRIAIVVRPDFLDDETRTRFQTARDAFDAATFTGLDSACSYLGVKPSTVLATIAELRSELNHAAPD